MFYLLKDGNIIEGTITKDKLMIKVKDHSTFLEIEQVVTKSNNKEYLEVLKEYE